MNETALKTALIAVGGIVSSLLGNLCIPLILMVVCNLVDYATGLIASGNRNDGGISSYKSMKGILKKISMWLLCVVGVVIDILLYVGAEQLGIAWPFSFTVACIVAMWIVCNELISILENLVDIGVPIPSFMMPLVKLLKKNVENHAPELKENDDEREEKK